MSEKKIRRGTRTIVLIIVALFAVASMIAVTQAWLARRHVRNVVLICMDTVRYDTFWLPERFGFRDAFSPWATRASRFDRVQSVSSWTVPAVASVFSGMYPVEHSAGEFQYGIANLAVMRPFALPNPVTTLPQLLGANGFATAAVNANPWLESTSILKDVGEPFFSKIRFVTPSSLDVLDRLIAGDKRYFFYAHYMDAHGDRPQAEKDAAVAKMDPALRKKVVASAPAGVCGDPASGDCAAYVAYVAEVLEIREHLAEVLTKLEEKKQLDDTAVIVFSDHGEEFKDHFEEEQQRGDDPRGYYGVGHGQSMYQELLHVPLLVWHPSITPKQITAPVSLVDLMPTILGWTGVAVPAKLSGVGLGDLSFRDASSASRALFSSGIAYGAPEFAVLQGDTKIIETVCPRAQLVFDLKSDAAEKRDRTDMRGSVVGQARALASYRTTKPVADRQAASLSSEQMKSLQAVGYLTSEGRATPQRSDCFDSEVFEAIGAYSPSSGIVSLTSATRSNAVGATIRTNVLHGYPVAGDWDGSGTTDVGVYKPEEKTFYLFSTTSPEAAPVRVVLNVAGDASGDIPVAGDWDGDGISSLGIYRPSVATFFLRNTNVSGPPEREIRFGKPGDVPVVGDWERKRADMVGVFRPKQATFYLAEDPEGKSMMTVPFGSRDDVPVAGDWDGDGTATIGVFNPSSRAFSLRNSNSEGDADLHVVFGDPDAIPIAGRWPSKAGG